MSISIYTRITETDQKKQRQPVAIDSVQQHRRSAALFTTRFRVDFRARLIPIPRGSYRRRGDRQSCVARIVTGIRRPPRRLALGLRRRRGIRGRRSPRLGIRCGAPDDGGRRLVPLTLQRASCRACARAGSDRRRRREEQHVEDEVAEDERGVVRGNPEYIRHIGLADPVVVIDDPEKASNTSRTRTILRLTPPPTFVHWHTPSSVHQTMAYEQSSMAVLPGSRFILRGLLLTCSFPGV
jgi:hypothetical protein